MPRAELVRASEQLESAATTASDPEAEQRLGELASQVADLAENERKADHGRIARLQAALDEIQPAVDDDAAATIADARDELSSFRKTLEGV